MSYERIAQIAQDFQESLQSGDGISLDEAVAQLKEIANQGVSIHVVLRNLYTLRSSKTDNTYAINLLINQLE